jgi:hypothetical protein
MNKTIWRPILAAAMGELYFHNVCTITHTEGMPSEKMNTTQTLGVSAENM